MNDNPYNVILMEIRKSKEELKNLIIASETRLQLKIEEQNGKILELEEENKFLKNKVEYLERETKKNKVVIFGLQKEPKEISGDYLCKEISERVGVKTDQLDISNFYCLGRNKNCPVKVEFHSIIKKNTILNNTKKLKNTGIAIVQDLTIKQREDRKILRENLQKFRRIGKESYIRKNKLFVDDNKEYSIDDLRNLEIEDELKRPNSTPATPTQVLIREPESQPIVYRGRDLRSNSSK